MKINLWIVVCHDFHSARGPFVDPVMALAEAKMMTKNSSSGCIYIPVLLKTEGQIVGDKTMLEDSAAKKDTAPYQGGQYL